MKITWFGHAAFGIEAGGLRILTDPYSSKIGFAPIAEAFDIVSLSHENPMYHSCLDEVLGAPEVVDGLALARGGEVLQRGEVRFGAVEVAGDEAGNEPNAMVWIEAEGVRVLHMGDCGHQPTPEQVAACGRVDVLLALAGAGPTLSIDALESFIGALKPPLVIPMHLAVPQLKTLSLGGVEALEDRFLFKARHDSHTIEVARDGLPLARPELLVLQAAR